MDAIKVAVQAVNPGQTVVITTDQPLYAVLKEIQELWPDTQILCAFTWWSSHRNGRTQVTRRLVER